MNNPDSNYAPLTVYICPDSLRLTKHKPAPDKDGNYTMFVEQRDGYFVCITTSTFAVKVAIPE